MRVDHRQGLSLLQHSVHLPPLARPACSTPTSASTPLMTVTIESQAKEIAFLKSQLATAEDRLERAQSFVFGLRCAAARTAGRGLWMKENDRSGLRVAIWEETEDLGAWKLIKSEDVPSHNPFSSSPLVHDLHSEFGTSSSSPPHHPGSFPMELFYHITEHTCRSTNYELCLVSSSLRAIASPRLYGTMAVDWPSLMGNFLTDPSAPPESFDTSLTLDKVINLDLIIPAEYEAYPILPIPSLRHLHLRSTDNVWSGPVLRTLDLALAQDFLHFLDPSSLTMTSAGQTRHDARLRPWLDVPQTAWVRSTSGWTRLNEISFVDCFWLYLTEHDSVHYTPPQKLRPTDIPHFDPSTTLHWTFTQECLGYAELAIPDQPHGYANLLELIFDTLKEVSWPYMTTNGIWVDVGERQVDLDAFRRDLRGLPEVERGLVHHLRGSGTLADTMS